MAPAVPGVSGELRVTGSAVPAGGSVLLVPVEGGARAAGNLSPGCRCNPVCPRGPWGGRALCTPVGTEAAL